MKTILLHGLGQTSRSWEGVQRLLDQDADAPELFDGAASYEEMLQRLEEEYGSSKEPLCLCGVSLGAILALDYAIRHEEQVKSLILVGVQYQVPTLLIDFQNFLFRWMPQRAFASTGVSKEQMMTLSRSLRKLDFRPQLHHIHCQVLIVCGEKDFANRKAAKQLKEILPWAELCWVPAVGHEVNKLAPEVLAALLNKQQEEKNS